MLRPYLSRLENPAGLVTAFMKIPPVGSFSRIGLAAIALLSFAACNSVKVTDVWVAPDVTKLHFKKVLAIAAIQEDGLRHVFEDALCTAMPKVQAIPSYQFIPAGDIRDVAKVSSELKAAKFDGVVVLRILGDRKETNVTTTMDYPGYGYGVPYGAYGGYGYPSAYRSFGGYYGGYAMGPYGYGGSSTTTVTHDQIFSVEANIYEFPGEKLVWTGVTESTSPEDINKMVQDVATAVRKELLKQKLIDQ